MSMPGLRAFCGHSYASIERIMAAAREVIAPDTASFKALDCDRIFNDLDRLALNVDRKMRLRLNYDVQDPIGDEEARTQFRPADGCFVVTLTPETAVGLDKKNGRARFTFCHELAHVLLHYKLLIELALNPERTSALARAGNHEDFEDTEWQANAGAAALLMPAAGLQVIEQIEGALEPSYFSGVFEVSQSAATRRLAVFEKHKARLVQMKGGFGFLREGF